MRLFDTIPRHDEGPPQFTEPEFPYLNRSARQDIGRIREMLEVWFSRYPASAQADLRGRFRSPDDTPHRSALFELFLHELLVRLGCQVEMHPDLQSASTRHPDFLVDSPNGGQFYMEAIVVTGESVEETKARARMHAVYDALNRMDSPYFYVIRPHGAPATQPSARHMRRFLEQKRASLDPDKIAARLNSGHHYDMPPWRYEHDGWKIDFFPIPKPPDMRGKAGVRPEEKQVPRSLMAWFHQERRLHTTEAIRGGVLKKAGRYGDLGLPYVIAINVLGRYMLTLTERRVIEIHLKKALFDPDGALHSSRPRYTRVSAVLLIALQSPWDVSSAYACLCHNPWAQKSYAAALTRLPQLLLCDGQMELQPGTSVGEILGLPLEGL